MNAATRASTLVRRREVQAAATRLVETIREQSGSDDRPEAWTWAQAVLTPAARQDFEV
jgi:hypothetical protein